MVLCAAEDFLLIDAAASYGLYNAGLTRTNLVT
jgi:Xaa-Pro aminopeptidase